MTRIRAQRLTRVLRLRVALAAVVAAAVLACSAEAPTSAERTPGTGGPRFETGYMNSGRVQEKQVGDTTISTFWYDPRRDESFGLAGTHKIYFPEYAVCDPKASSYGPGTWLQPCTPLETKIKITAKSWTTADGRPYVNFEPALRFVPDAPGPRPVTLWLYDKEAAKAATMAIVYCTAPGSCVDESVGDPTLQTHRDPNNGFLYRRIRHFSGYNVSGGATQTPTDGGGR